MSDVIGSIRSEFEKYKELGELALSQLEDGELSIPIGEGGNSAANLVRHLAGNLHSRFTDFLTTDGDKPWRNRDEEFAQFESSRESLQVAWNQAWAAVAACLAELSDEDLPRVVQIGGADHTVPQALHRALAHTAYHIGQIVCIAKTRRGADWKDLKTMRASSQ